MPPSEDEVVLLGCRTYDRGAVSEKVEEAFELLGGAGSIVLPGRSVFVKVNGLLPIEPDQCATTHPEVVRAVVLELKKVTPRVTIGDCPGGPLNRAMLRRLYEKCGFARVAEETGALLNYDVSEVRRSVPSAKKMKSILLSRPMAESDHLVSIPKLKTHLLMGISCAIKNLYGTVPGMTKFTYHSMHHAEEDFADLLVDINLAVRPALHVIDAVRGQEGNGSVWGEPRDFGFLAAGRDAFSLDTVMTDLLGLPVSFNLPLRAAVERGLCGGDPSGVEVTGDRREGFRVPDLHMPLKTSTIKHLPGFFMRRYGSLMSVRPRPLEGRCTGCGKCVEICPRGAMSLDRGVAIVNLKDCIRCYCCQELCEHDGIELVRPGISRLLRI